MATPAEDNSTVSGQLRAAILASPETRYRIAQATGVTEAALSRFVRGLRGLDLTSVDKLATHLGLGLSPIKRQRKVR